MALAPNQMAFIEDHLDKPTVVRGTIDGWTDNGDGTVTFNVAYVARLPLSPEQEEEARQRAEEESAANAAAAEAAEEARRNAEAEAEAAFRNDLKVIVREVLAEGNTPEDPGTARP